MYERHCDLALIKVLAELLSQIFLACHVVQYVVGKLKSNASLQSEFRQGFLPCLGLSRNNGAYPACRRDKYASLCRDDLEVFVHGNFGIAGFMKLQELSFCHPGSSLGKRFHDLLVPLINRKPQGVGIEEISDEDHHLIPPDRMSRGLAPSGFSTVDNIVVEQRCGVDRFDD